MSRPRACKTVRQCLMPVCRNHQIILQDAFSSNSKDVAAARAGGDAGRQNSRGGGGRVGEAGSTCAGSCSCVGNSWKGCRASAPCPIVTACTHMILALASLGLLASSLYLSPYCCPVRSYVVVLEMQNPDLTHCYSLAPGCKQLTSQNGSSEFMLFSQVITLSQTWHHKKSAFSAPLAAAHLLSQDDAFQGCCHCS